MMPRLPGFLCVLLLAAPVAQAEDALGSLFTTPAQRALLDKLPLLPSEAAVIEKSKLATTEVEPAVAPVKKTNAGGLIVNSKGQSTTWRNDGTVTRADKNQKTAITSSGRVDALLHSDGNAPAPKSGEAPESVNGTAVDSDKSNVTRPAGAKCRSSKAPGGEMTISCE